jgi:NTP pyrophosphatase (non-canonical NTP hydrolase)
MGDLDSRHRILQDILAERLRQLRKWGDQSHTDDRWAVIEGEEFGEVCRAIFEGDNIEHLREELVQVAAVAVAWIEDIDARGTS